MGEPNTASLAAPVADVHAGPAEDNVEVHTVDTNAGIVPGKETFSNDKEWNWKEGGVVTGFGGQQSSETLSWYYDLLLLYVELFRRPKPGTKRPRQRFRPRGGVSHHEQSHEYNGKLLQDLLDAQVDVLLDAEAEVSVL